MPDIVQHVNLITIVIAAVILPPFWMIFKKAGFSPWLSLLIYAPVINLITLYVVAFSKWKIGWDKP